MRIVETINGILSAMQTDGILASHHYQTPSKSNVVMDYSSTPTAVFTCLTERLISVGGATSKERARVVVDFVNRTNDLDFNGNDAEQTIVAMAGKAEVFIARLMQSELEIVDDEVSLVSLYDFLDATTTGVRLSMNVKERQGHCLNTTITNNEDNQEN